jgi:hypothetical protein
MYFRPKRTNLIKIECPERYTRKTSFSTLVEKGGKISRVAPGLQFSMQTIASGPYQFHPRPRIRPFHRPTRSFRVQLIDDREHLTDQWQWSQTDSIVSHGPVSSVQSRGNCKCFCNPAQRYPVADKAEFIMCVCSSWQPYSTWNNKLPTRSHQFLLTAQISLSSALCKKL